MNTVELCLWSGRTAVFAKLIVRRTTTSGKFGHYLPYACYFCKLVGLH